MTPNQITRYLTAFLLAGSLFYSCKKDGKIGLDTQPSNDLISANFRDTSTILSYVVKDDSIKTSRASLILLGSYNDQYFGSTSCSFYSQLNTLNNSEGIDLANGGNVSDLRLDSAVLTLQYAATASDNRKLYGSAFDPQTINVYKLAQPLIFDSSYYSTRTLPIGALIASKTISAFYPDSFITIGAFKTAPHLRIKIDSVFGDSILRYFSIANNTTFHNAFKGIYVTPANGAQSSQTGAIFYINPGGAQTRLTLYYRKNVSNPAKGDTVNYSFEINSSTAYYNHFQHDFTATPVANALTIEKDTDLIYLQSLAGVRTKIMLPNVMNWASKGPIAVNKAELIFNVDPSTSGDARYNPHTQLFILPIDSLGKFNLPIDYLDPATRIQYGGTYSAATNQYVFNISEHIHRVISGKIKNYGFYLLGAGSGVNAQRTVLYGASKTNSKRILFRLTYTKLN